VTRFFALLLLASGTAQAQPRSFNCIGAERLDDDAFAIPFASRGASPGEAARANIAAVAALAKAAPERNVCVLGHAGGREGGATAGRDLAARRARAVADALSRAGVERDRIRAEARTAAFSTRARQGDNAAAPAERSVTVVVLPAPP